MDMVYLDWGLVLTTVRMASNEMNGVLGQFLHGICLIRLLCFQLLYESHYGDACMITLGEGEGEGEEGGASRL
ncbi:hypothetical protein Scep_008402 [Stephania cephalantha]|uniref:Uncharacterized protein n=1 Tax=Stephania cephalantha TaxID=152367 RepID=A0AAP0KCU1_9MAGN